MCETKEMKLWINKRFYELSELKTVEEKVDEAMNPKYIRVQVRSKNGKEWI